MVLSLSPGDDVRLEMTKWGDRPHWSMAARYLGSDAAGDWIGLPAATRMSRPGREIRSPNEQIGLVPAAGSRGGGAWLATFHGPGGEVWTYVDMTSRPTWDGPVIRAIDLDLDVIELLDHTVFVDDEDEFAEHRVAFGYPEEVVALALTSRDVVLDALRRRLPPFDGSAAPWFHRLHQLVDLSEPS
jgi:uncharacterized protein